MDANQVYLVAGVGASAAVVLPVAWKPMRRPFRWLWRRNVAEPVDAWFRHMNEESTRKIAHEALAPVTAKVENLASTLEVVEHAVNGRPDDEQTISQDIRQLRQTVAPLRTEVTIIAGQMSDVRREVAATRAELTMTRERVGEVSRKADLAAREASKAASNLSSWRAGDPDRRKGP